MSGNVDSLSDLKGEMDREVGSQILVSFRSVRWRRRKLIQNRIIMFDHDDLGSFWLLWTIEISCDAPIG